MRRENCTLIADRSSGAQKKRMESHYHDTDSDLLIITSKGGLDDSLAMAFVRDLYDRIDNGLRKIIVDCSDMDYISSLDLSVLARVRSRITDKGGNLRICSAEGMVREVLRVTNLDKLFDLHSDLAGARQAFEKDA